MNCAACMMKLKPGNHLMFELSLEPGVKVKDAKLKQRGFVCPNIMCLAIATGCEEE